MSGPEIAGGVILALGAAAAAGGTVRHVRSLQARPYRPDVAPAKGSAARGVRYAFTEGMAPWAKESTRRHPVAYLRGIAFHGGVFLAIALLPAGPWLHATPAAVRVSTAVALGASAVLAASGLALRLHEPGLRRLSTPDDYASLVLVSALLAAGTAAAVARVALPAYWAAAGLTLAYAPFGKIRHSVYFFYSRTFFGAFFGGRGVLAAAR